MPGPAAYLRLMRAGWVLAREGGLAMFDRPALPAGMRRVIGLGRLIEKRDVRRTGRVAGLARALTRLGPTYVKLGQLLAARPDIVGPEIAMDLGGLQDRMEPFDSARLTGILERSLGNDAGRLTAISAPVAAASIAQVHKATVADASGAQTEVALKVLRPGIVERFGKDLEAVRAMAGLAEALVPKSRRLRPIAVAETLERSARLELDLRLEAAAISEVRENIGERSGIRVPAPIWDLCASNVLVTEWVEAIPLSDPARLDTAGIDRKALAVNLIRQFLHQAIEDGYFHADLHPGNLFADPGTGDLILVDFGIMGRIGRQERRFLAEILYGFITRDYLRMAKLHIAIGYVPDHHSAEDFATALRAIGEPLNGRTASAISMADVLGQLMAVTELYDMTTRTELVLLQKTMVLAEGVARQLDPELDMWSAAEPIASAWVRRAVGPEGRFEAFREQVTEIGGALAKVPGLIGRYESLLDEAEEARARRPFYLHPLFGALVVAALAGTALAAWRFVFGG